MPEAGQQVQTAVAFTLEDLLQQVALFRVAGLAQTFAGNLGACAFGAEQSLQQCGLVFGAEGAVG
ncbi:hypothetical protein D9M71_762480 [compost metagenome]